MSSNYKTAESPWFGETEHTVGIFRDGQHLVMVQRRTHSAVYGSDGQGNYTPLPASVITALEATPEWHAAMIKQPQPPVWLLLTDEHGVQQLVEGTQDIADLLGV